MHARVGAHVHARDSALHALRDARAVPAQAQRWEEAEYELDSEMSEAESSEEKRLAFACLAGAIEEVGAATSAPSSPP